MVKYRMKIFGRTKVKNIPIKHHYIPQFILKNFCDEEGFLWYKDIKTNTIENFSTKDIYFENNLYRDEREKKDKDSVEIELALSKYEDEISKILLSRYYSEKKFYITLKEQEAIKLFIAIMGFRSKRASEYFKNTNGDLAKDYYHKYQNDEDYDYLWKRNLKELVKCRSYMEVMLNPDIDDPIKGFMLRDTGGTNSFIRLIESENEEFILSDAIPFVMCAEDKNGMELIMYEAFPISPKRALLIIYKYPQYNIRYSDSILSKGFFEEPVVKDGKIEIYVKTIKDERVKEFNRQLREISQFGLVSRTDKFN